MRQRAAYASIFIGGLVVGVGVFVLGINALPTSAANPPAHPSRYFDLRTGDNLNLAPLDLGCSFFGPGDRFHDKNYGFICSRDGAGRSLGVDVSPDWIRMFKYSTPRPGLKQLVCQHRRNP